MPGYPNNNPAFNRIEAIVAGKLDNYLNDTLRVHVDKFGIATYVTYFHNTPYGTSDPHLDATFDDVGPNSPSRYAEIKHFPLFRFEGTFTSLEQGEYGPEDSYEAECVVVPMNFRPVVDDYILVTILSTRYLLKVTNVEVDRFHEQDKYYKLTIELVSDTVDSIRQQVVATPRIVPNTTLEGTGVLLEEQDANSVEVAMVALEMLHRVLIQTMEHFSLPVIDGGFTHLGKRPVVTEVVDAMIRSNITSLQHRYNSQYIIDTSWRDYNQLHFDRKYYDSIFGYFDISYMQDGPITEECPDIRFCQLSQYNRLSNSHGRYKSAYPQLALSSMTESNTALSWEMIPESFITGINENNLYDDDNHILEDLVITRRNTGYDAMITLLTSKLTQLERGISRYNPEQLYYLVPLVMILLKKAESHYREQIVNYFPE